MNLKNKKESYPVGTPRNVILEYLRKDENEWTCIEIEPTKKSQTRKIIFIKDEKYKFENEDMFNLRPSQRQSFQIQN